MPNSKPSRYVAIISESEGIKSTFVFEGGITLDDMFEKINAHSGLLPKWKDVASVSVHRDESLEPTLTDEMEQMFAHN